MIFRSNDVGDLAEQMMYCVKNRDRLQILGENARATYEKYFTMEVFGGRLEQIIGIDEAERNKIPL